MIELTRLENVPENVKALPVVVVKNFATSGQKDEILDALAEWVRTLVDNQVRRPNVFLRIPKCICSQIAHVIVLSDNRENSKRLAKGERIIVIFPLGVLICIVVL